MILYRADGVRGRNNNPDYPIRCEINNAADLDKVVCHDVVGCLCTHGVHKNGKPCKGNHRDKHNFIESYCLLLDLDDGKGIEDLRRALPGVKFYYHPSKSHMKAKGNKPAVPRYHVLMELKTPIKNYDDYVRMHAIVRSIFPFADEKAKDGVRYFNGVEDPQSRFVEGELCIDEYIAFFIGTAPHEANTDVQTTTAAVDPFEALVRNPFEVQEEVAHGGRNDYMFKFICSLQARGLSNDMIEHLAIIENEKVCDPPLPLHDNGEDVGLLTTIRHTLSRYDKGMSGNPDVEAVKPILARCQNGKLKSSVNNFSLIALNDPRTKGKIRYNELVRTPYIVGADPWRDDHKEVEREWTDTDDAYLKTLIERDYEGLWNEGKYMTALNLVADKNRYNPLTDTLDWLAAEHTEDGYIRKLLPCFLGAEDTDYNYEVMKLTLLGAVARAYDSGCKFDYALMLRGGQGIGKSTFARRLALRDEWFCDSLDSLEGRDNLEKLLGHWIVELPELSSMNNTKSIEAVKSFITTQCDKYRRAYGRRTETFPRSCIFIGTSNTDEFLRDATGNRRFLVVDVNKEDPEKRLSLFTEDCKVMFEKAIAEAVRLYKSNPGIVLVLPNKYQAEAEAMQRDASTDGALEEDILWYLTESEEGKKLDLVCCQKLYEGLKLGNPFERMPRSYSLKIGGIMRRMKGWRSVGNKRIEGYGSVKAFERIK